MTLTDKFKQIGRRSLPILLMGMLLNPLNAQDKNKEKNDWLYHGLEAGFITLNIVDYILTNQASKHEGFREANFLIRPFVKNKRDFALYKSGITLATLYCVRKVKRDNPKLAYGLLISMNLIGEFIIIRI